MVEMGRHVFVSYSRKDQDYTHKLVDELQKRGFEVWIDDRIDFGDWWWKEIDRAIRTCAAFVVVMTPDSEASEWVEREVQLAMREGKVILPLLLRGKGHSILITTQHDNVSDGRMPGEDFHDRLRRQVGGPGVAEPVRIAKREVLRRTITVGGVELVLIPPGEFTMGSGKGHGDEKPVHKVYLDAFYIGKYPITNVQYKRFVEATRRRAPRHWSGGRIPEGKENHPVVMVSWYDARAYCKWLAEETGEIVRLPTEAEWEKAARGTDGRLYPWGNEFDGDRCNTWESDIRDTTAVGEYSPRGDSPYGAADMAGNVWEWMSSLYKDYPYNPDDGRENPEANGSRVLRGGSFYGDRDLARVPCRSSVDPDDFNVGYGLRVVLLPAGSP
jgi:formylglycine-generating enzyme required for sulfatase activity